MFRHVVDDRERRRGVRASEKLRQDGIEELEKGEIPVGIRLLVEAREETIAPDGLRGADEVFITSSLRGVLPVTRVDGRAVADGRVGPLTRRLGALYDAAIGLADGA